MISIGYKNLGLSSKEVRTISEEKVKAEVPYVDKTKPIVSKHGSGSTYAQENDKTSAEEFGKYIGIGIGQSSLDVSDPDADSIDDTDTSLKIFVGADINPNFAVEFGYIDFGEFSAHYPLYDENDCAEGSALFATAICQADITGQFRLFGKLGFAYWDVDFTADATILGTPISASGDGTGMDLLYGIGINSKATDQISIRAEWEQYKDVGDGVDVTIPGVGSVELEGEDLDVLGVALIYNF